MITKGGVSLSKVFKCLRCGLTFKSDEDLKKHAKEHQSKPQEPPRKKGGCCC